MQPSADWSRFRRMQTSLAVAGALALAACALDALRVSHAPSLARTAVVSVGILAVTVASALLIPPLRRRLRGHLMTSYRSGFGQGLVSVSVGLTVILGAAAFLLWRIHTEADPGAAFAAFAAGLGLLIAQVVLVSGPEEDF